MGKCQCGSNMHKGYACLCGGATIVDTVDAVRNSAVADVMDELTNAMNMWPAFNSAHEGIAVLDEERDELWGHVKVNQKRRDIPAMRKEAMQVAAMALRFMIEVCNEEVGRK